MNDSKDYIEKELGQLAEKIFEDFKTRSYSANLYSIVFSSIISTFLKIRFSMIFQKLNTGKDQKNRKYDFESTVRKLYDQLYYGKRSNELNKINFENLLIELLPSCLDIIYSSEFFNKDYKIEDLLQYLSTYGIQISKTDLINYDHVKNSYKLSAKLSQKYKDLFLNFLTIYLSLVDLQVESSDLPGRLKKIMKFKKGTKEIDINDTILNAESYILKLLIKTLNKDGKFINSLYCFPDKEQEVRNLTEYIQTNDVWKLDIITPDFMLLKDEKPLDKEVDTKLKLIREVRADNSLVISYGAKMLYLEAMRYQNESYLKHLEIELKERFEEWYYHPFISDWENYWFGEKHRLLQNEIIESYKPKGYTIDHLGDGWEVIFKGKKKFLKDLLGIYYFSLCLKSPGTEFPYATIKQSYLYQGLSMREEEYALFKNRRKVKKDIDFYEANYNEDPTNYELQLSRLYEELKKIDAVLKKIRLSSSNSSISDRRKSDNFTKACRKALMHCKEVFPEFYEHVKCYVSWKNGMLTYSGYLDWL
jgi:hypothetical protein